MQLAETPFSKAIKGKSKIPLSYEFLKIEPEYSVQPMPKDVELDPYPVKWKVADIIDAEGLTIFKNPKFPLLRGSKGVRFLFDSELGASNFDEALKIYQWLEKVNIKGNDLDVVKTMRRTNLGKLYRATDKLRPFVEKEMSKWKYTEEEKIAIRGTKISGNELKQYDYFLRYLVSVIRVPSSTCSSLTSSIRVFIRFQSPAAPALDRLISTASLSASRRPRLEIVITIL